MFEMKTETKGPGRPAMPESKRANAQIQLRVKRRQKSAFVRRSSSLRKTLSAWLLELANKDSGYIDDES
jgi:hypothetical protein